MNLRCVLAFEYGSQEEARAVEKALGPDNEGFVITSVEGGVLKARVEARTAESLRHTLDDFLACVRVAEEAVGIERADVPDKDV